MRKSTQILAPAFVLGALILGGYRLAAYSVPASRATSGVDTPSLSIAVAVATQATALDPTTEPEVTLAVPSPDGGGALAGQPLLAPEAGPADGAGAVALAVAGAPGPRAQPAPTLEPTVQPSPTCQPTANRPAATRLTAQKPKAVPSPARVAAKPAQRAAAPAPAGVEALQPPTRIVAPAIGLDAKVVTVGWHPVEDADGGSHTEWDVASYAAGWHKNSALPGQAGNMVIAAHNNIEGEIFRNLEKLQPGDEIIVYAGDRSLSYKVAEKFVVQDKNVPFEQRLANAKWIGPFPDERLTLVSCYPPTDNTHRMFVVAHPSPKS